VSELLASMKLLCIQMWPQHTDSLDDLRLEIALRMLKSPHFNAKMNSLKEVSILYCLWILHTKYVLLDRREIII